MRATPQKVQYSQGNQSKADRSFNSDAEYYKQKCQELEQENLYLQEQAALANQQAKDVQVGDNRLESFVRENSSLHLENEKLAKVVKQRKTEADLWKQKYENQMQQVIQIKANYEQEIRALQSEVQKLLARLEEFEFDKQRQVLEQKAAIDQQASNDIDTIKKGQQKQNDLYDSQIRKLRDQVDEQANEINDLQAKLLRLKAEDDQEIERLLRENEQLRVRINQMDIDKQRELEDLNDSLNKYTLQQIDNLKQEFAGHADVMEKEISKLKGLLEIKNAEIDTLVQQNQRLKNQYEQDTAELREEISLLKQKMLEQERQARKNLEQLQTDMHLAHDHDLADLRLHYDNQIDNLNKEINDLNNLLKKKDDELQVHMNEKNQLRFYLEKQIEDLKAELEEQKIRFFEMEKAKNHEIQELEDSNRRIQSQYQEQIDQLKAQVNFLEGEISKLKEQLNQKTNELESAIQQFSLAKKGLEEDIRRLKNLIDELKTELLQLEYAKNNEIDDLKARNQRLENTLREKIRQLEILNEQQAIEMKRLKEQLDIKHQELENMATQRNLLDKDLRRVKEDLDFTKAKLINLEREKNISFEELKNKLEDSNSYQITNLKAAFNTQISVLTEENDQLKQQLESRKYDIQDLLEKYENLRRGIEGGQYGPEIATTKNIYDVYLKSKSKQPRE